MTRLRHRQTYIHQIKTIGLMLNELSPFHHKCTETAQACTTCREGTAKEVVWGAPSMPVANLRQILFVFSARLHEELMKLSGAITESGENQSMAKTTLLTLLCKTKAIYESLPLASATGPNPDTHSYGQCVCFLEMQLRTWQKRYIVCLSMCRIRWLVESMDFNPSLTWQWKKNVLFTNRCEQRYTKITKCKSCKCEDANRQGDSGSRRQTLTDTHTDLLTQPGCL